VLEIHLFSFYLSGSRPATQTTPKDRQEEEAEEEVEDERGRDDASVDDDEEKEEEEEGEEEQEEQFPRPTRFVFLLSTLVPAFVL